MRKLKLYINPLPRNTKDLYFDKYSYKYIILQHYTYAYGILWSFFSTYIFGIPLISMKLLLKLYFQFTFFIDMPYF